MLRQSRINVDASSLAVGSATEHRPRTFASRSRTDVTAGRPPARSPRTAAKSPRAAARSRRTGARSSPTGARSSPAAARSSATAARSSPAAARSSPTGARPSKTSGKLQSGLRWGANLRLYDSQSVGRIGAAASQERDVYRGLQLLERIANRRPDHDRFS